MDRLHQLAEERSLAIHRVVADQLRAQPELLVKARRRVRSWRRQKSVADIYVIAWEEILKRPVEAVCQVLSSRDPHAIALRQVSPFAGVVDPKTRWRIWRRVRQKHQSESSVRK